MGGAIRCIRARPWPERPVSEANKSGCRFVTKRWVCTFARCLLVAERMGGAIRCIRARPWPERPVSEANKSGCRFVTKRWVCTFARCLLVAE